MLSRDDVRFEKYYASDGARVATHIAGELRTRATVVLLPDPSEGGDEIARRVEEARDNVRTKIMRAVYGDIVRDVTDLLASAPVLLRDPAKAEAREWGVRRDALLGRLGGLVK